jgi:hypothetical protein
VHAGSDVGKAGKGSERGASELLTGRHSRGRDLGIRSHVAAKAFVLATAVGPPAMGSFAPYDCSPSAPQRAMG